MNTANIILLQETLIGAYLYYLMMYHSNIKFMV